MKSTKLSLLVKFLVLGATLTGCGEAFEGRFRGDAYLPESCGITVDPNGYSLEIRAQVSNESFNFDLTSLLRKSNNTPDQQISSHIGDVSGSSGISNTAFGNTKETSNGVVVSFSGKISTARDQIDNFIVRYQTTRSDGSDCQIQVQAKDSLKLVQ